MASQALKVAALAAIATLGGLSAAQAGPTSVACGALIKSIVRTNNPAWITTSLAFVNVPTTPMNIIVPAGEKQCIKVRFSAELSCAGECFVRAMAGDIAMDPSPYVTFSASSASERAHSFEWMKQLDPGTYQVRMQVAVEGGAGKQFYIPAWTMHVEITK